MKTENEMKNDADEIVTDLDDEMYKIVKRYFEDVNEHEDIIDLKRIHAGWEVRVYKLSKSDIYHNADINQILTSQEYVSQR